MTEQIVEFNLGWKPRKDRKGMGSQKDRKKMIFLFLSLLYPFAILFLSFFYLFAISFLSFWKPILFLSVSYPFVIPSFFVFFCYLFSVFQLWPTLQICLGFKMFCFAKDLRVLQKKHLWVCSVINPTGTTSRERKQRRASSISQKTSTSKWARWPWCQMATQNHNQKCKPRICKIQTTYLQNANHIIWYLTQMQTECICDQEWTCLSACPP